jgi:hypothetical protein
MANQRTPIMRLQLLAQLARDHGLVSPRMFPGGFELRANGTGRSAVRMLTWEQLFDATDPEAVLVEAINAIDAELRGKGHT